MLKLEKHCANWNGRKRGAGANVSGDWDLRHVALTHKQSTQYQRI